MPTTEEAAVQQQVAADDFSSTERKNAHRSLTRMSTDLSGPASEEMVTLFCALRRVKGNQARINMNLLNSWQTRVQQSTRVKQMFWVVPEESPCLQRADVQQFIVPAESLAEVPPGLLDQKVVFVDQVVERSKLGAGWGHGENILVLE